MRFRLNPLFQWYRTGWIGLPGHGRMYRWTRFGLGMDFHVEVTSPFNGWVAQFEVQLLCVRFQLFFGVW